MVLSMARARAEASGPGEWQEDSGLSLYRAPEEGDTLGAGAATSAQSVDLEKKVSLNRSNVKGPVCNVCQGSSAKSELLPMNIFV